MSSDYWDDPGVKAAEEAYEKARKAAEKARREAERDEAKREYATHCFTEARKARRKLIATENTWYAEHPDRIPHKRNPFGVRD